jgi:DNA-binding LacI/PurR family transcriptional regulator
MSLEQRPARATSLDVARRAGLSRSTVSQVLNGNHERFPAETRERVEAAAAELGYRPSRAGRALVTGVSDLIVVAVPNVTFGRHLQDAVDRIAAATASRGMSVVVRYAGDDDDATLTAVLDLRPAAVVDLGVFTSPEARRALEAGGTQVVPDLSIMETFAEHPNHLIGRIQADHLLEQPGRRLVVATLDDSREDHFGSERRQGVIDTARDAGLPEPATISVPLDRSRVSAVLASVVEPGLPIGVCCYNDDVAIAVLAAARVLGLTVPDDVAVVGVDHTEIGALVDPPLTSIAIDMPGMMPALLAGLDILRDPLGPQPESEQRPFSEFVRLVRGGST